MEVVLYTKPRGVLRLFPQFQHPAHSFRVTTHPCIPSAQHTTHVAVLITPRRNRPAVSAIAPLSRVRQRVKILREEKRALLAKGNRTVPIQAIFRGFITRRDDKLLGVRMLRCIRKSAGYCVGVSVSPWCVGVLGALGLLSFMLKSAANHPPHNLFNHAVAPERLESPEKNAPAAGDRTNARGTTAGECDVPYAFHGPVGPPFLLEPGLLRGGQREPQSPPPRYSRNAP